VGDAIKMGLKGIGLKGIKGVVSLLPDEKRVINKLEPTFRFEMPRVDIYGFKVLHKDVSRNRK